MEPSKNTQDGTSPSSWSVNQVCLWLEGQTLGGIVPFVRDQEMCGYALVHLDSEELLKTHVPLGTRIMLKDACKLLKVSLWVVVLTGAASGRSIRGKI